MGSPAFGSNGMSDADGGLTKSLLEEATLIKSLDDNSAFLGLSRELKNTFGTDHLSSGLDHLLTSNAANKGNSSSNSDRDLANPSSLVGNVFDHPPLFSSGQFVTSVSSQLRGSKSTASNKTTSKDIITGSTKDTPLVSFTSNDFLTNAGSALGTIADPVTPRITAALLGDTAPNGGTNTDLITNDPTIAGKITGANRIKKFLAGFKNTPPGKYFNVLPDLKPDGSFTLKRDRLEQIFGGTIPDGRHTLQLWIQDERGNSDKLLLDVSFTLDTVAPAAPKSLDLLASSDSGDSNSDNLTSNTTPIISGTAPKGELVQLFSDRQLVGQTNATSGGLWQIATTRLTDGTHTLTATTVDVAGNVSTASDPLNVVIDTTAPTTPSGLRLTERTETGASTSDNITSITTPAIQGTGETGSLIRLHKDGQLVSQTTATADGSWQLAVDPLNDGLYTFVATAEDLAGNVSSLSNQIAVTIDTTAPTAPSNLALFSESDSGSSNSDNITSNTTPTVTGKAEAGEVVQLSSEGRLVGQTTATTNGTWQIKVNPLADGVHALTATATDAAGNASAYSTPLALAVDTVLPRLTLTTPVDTAPLTQKARLVGSVDGTGSAVTASYHFDNLTAVPVALSTSGTFDQQLDFTGINNGSHTLTVMTTDKAGNVTTSNFNVTVNLDTTPPAITAALVKDTLAGSSTNTDRITSEATITGTVTDASAVKELRAGFNDVPTANWKNVTAQLGADGSFTLDRTGLDAIYGGTLPDGLHTLHLLAIDEYGNSSPIFDYAFTLDTTSPQQPVFKLDEAADPDGDQRTTVRIVTLTGQTEANATIVLPDIGTTTADASGQFQIPGVSLALSANSFTIQAIDAAGNTNSFTTTVTRTASSDVVLDWNATLLKAIQTDRTAPPLAARNMAMVHAAMYDAVNAITRTHSVYHVDAQAPAGASAAAAAAEAAYRVLVNLYPLQIATFNAALATSLAAIPDGTAENDGVALGQRVADSILAWRSTDGSSTVLAKAPGIIPGVWQPTLSGYNAALLPQWLSVTPFAMTGGSQFRPAGPPALESAEYAADFDQVKELGRSDSTTRTADQTEIAYFWADGAGTYTPPGHWNQIAELAAQEQGNTLEENARLFALLNIGLADAGIAAWDAKYVYDLWRPITAIRQAETDGNAATIGDPTWTPLIVTPPFPEYVSGHSTFSGTADAILTDFFGANFGFTTTSLGLPGVTRSFSNFTQAAEEAGMSRIVGGIHFQAANRDGLATGRALGDYVLENFLVSNVRSELLKVGLANDTSPDGTNRDNITADPMIAGTVTIPNKTARLKAGFGDAAATSFFDVTSSVGALGQFTLSITQLAQIYGAPLKDGAYTLHLLLEDSQGNVLGSDAVSFTLDTAQPSVSLETLDATGNYSSTARLMGKATDTGSSVKSARYSLDGQAFSPLTVDSTGQFSQTISPSPLAAGAHRTVVEVFDAAGNSTAITADFTVTNDFVVGAALTEGWGVKTANSITLGEQNSFVTQTAVNIELGQTQGTRLLEFELNAQFDNTDTTTATADRLLVYLVDPNNSNSTLLDRGEPGTALFSLWGKQAEYVPGLVRFDGKRVQIDLSSLGDKTSGQLIFQLLNNDSDTGSVVRVQNLTNTVDPEGVSSLVFPTPISRTAIGPAVSLDNFKTASDAQLLVSNVRLDAMSGRYTADIQVRNTGTQTISRQLAVVFTNLPDGVELLDASGLHPAGSPYINLRNAIQPGGLAAGAISDTVQVIFDDPSLLRFALQPVFLAGPPDRSPELASLGSLSVLAGGRLSIPLVGSDPDGDAVTFSLRSDKPLPTGSLEGGRTLVFTPSPQQVGTYHFTLVASSGGVETTQDVTLTVAADPVSTTRISGVIQNTDQAPLAGVVVELGGWQTTTAADGSFTLEFHSALNSDTLKVRGELVSGSVVYPFIAEKLPLVLEHEVYAGVNNVIARPIYLPPLDTANGQTINPAVDTTVTSAALPGSSVFVAANTLLNRQNNPFTGKLSITEVPTNLTPAALPEGLHPDLVVTVQPGEMVFTRPAPLSLPNTAGYAPGTLMDLWSINPNTGNFDNVGTGKVSADGSVIETISGGIRNSSWHFFAPPPEVAKNPNTNPRNLEDGCDDCKAKASFNSDVELHSGAVVETHNLVTYQSLGATRGLTLTYDSLRADPRPIVHLGYDNVDTNSIAPGFTDKLRLLAKLKVHRGGFEYQVPGFAPGQYGLTGGEHFWSLPAQSGGAVDAALQVDLRDLPSGQYDYSLQSGIRLFVRDQFLGSSSTSEGKFLHVNSINSAFGSGWGLSGLQELIENEDGSILLIDGDGSELLFKAPTVSGNAYDAPPGDFSKLERLADGTFRRTFKDQTVYLFNAQNKLERVRSRNGNETHYVYNEAGQLTKVIDPVGLETVFTYQGAKVSSIIDPAGRVTQLKYDAAGNLAQIIDPDDSQRSWQYDSSRHMMAEVDKRGYQETAAYDFAGRAKQATRKDGSVVSVNPIQVQGLYRPEATINPLSAPSVFSLGAPEASYVDGNGNVVRTLLDRAGQAVSSSDGAGLLPSVQRDSENLVTQKTDGRGNATEYTYDERGNLLRVSEQSSSPDTWVTVPDDALLFDGINDQVINKALANVSNTFTMEFWVNPTATRNSTPETNTGVYGIGGQRYAIAPSHGEVEIGVNHAGVGVSVGTNGISVFEHSAWYLPSPLVHNTSLFGWNHVAIVYNNKTPSLYLNGQFIETGLTSTYTVHPSALLGDISRYGAFKGQIDEFRIWDRTRTQAEIQADMNRQLSGGETGLVGYWTFDEQRGSTAFDQTANAHHGNLVGPTWLDSSVVYYEDFESGAGTEWSSTTTDNSYPGTFTRFSGRFSNGSQTLTLPTVPGETYTIKFDFYAIDTWDGNYPASWGMDYFNVSIDGRRVFHETFNNHNPSYFGSSFSQSFRPPDQGGVTTDLGFGSWSNAGDSIYRGIPIVFTATASTTQILFADSGIEGLYNESWGIDNVKLTKVVETYPSVVSRRFTYDPTFNQLTSTTDELGRQTLYNIDPTNGNILSATQVVGAVGGTDDLVTRYTYTPFGLVDIITDPLGRITDFDYDALGRVVTITSAKGTSDAALQRFEYDLAGNRTALVDENGNRTELAYDAHNRLVKVTGADPDGVGPLTSPITTFAYDAAGNLITTTDARNNVTQNEYNALNRRTKVIDALKGVTSFGYDTAGNLESVTDALDHTTKMRYDRRNRLIETIDPQAGRTQYRYDFDNNLTAFIDPLGNRTNYVYDSRNRLVKEIDPLSHTTAYSYDPVNNLIAQTDKNGYTTKFNYDDLNRLIQSTDALGGVATTTYDAVGNVVATTDELKRNTRYTYDNRDRLTQVTDALNGISKFGYDAAGNLLSFTDELNRTTIYNYDALNRRTAVTDPLNHQTNYTYDAVDNLTAVTDALNRTKSYRYDALNRRTDTIDALENIATTSYDAVGNVTAVTDELGRTTKFTYSRRNLLTAVTDELGHTTTRVYDLNGNVVAISDALGQTTRYRYDALNRQTGVIDALGKTTTTTYDAVGNVLSITDPVGNTTTYTYDALERLVTDTNALSKTRTYQYDAVGNQIAATDRNGRKRGFTYDALDRQTAEKWLDASGNTIRTFSLGYDAASQLKTASDPNSAYSYTYDLVGHLTSFNNAGTPGVPNVVLGYTYDSVGNRLTVTDTIGGQLKGTEAFTYDELNRVSRITQSGSGVANKRVDFGYNKASELTSLTRYADLNGTGLVANSTYTYDNAGRLTNLTHAKGATTFAGYTWVYDAANRIRQFTSPDGTSTYTYDVTDQLTGTDHSFQADEAYTYEANGNRTNTGYQTGSNNRLLSDGKFNYEYDNEGNRTKRTEIATGKVTEYTWDYRNRLTRVVEKTASGNVIKQSEYSYDVFDRRIAKSVDPDGAGSTPATVERFVYDGDHIALTFDGNGNQTHRYLHGPQIDQILAEENASGQVLWALTDNQGTVRDLVDSTGSIQNHITYDSFGQITGETNPAIDTRFGYTGRESDAETGQYYYRARYYDAGVGRFISEDPIGFTAGDTNLYRYVFNSPTNFTDPSGLIVDTLLDVGFVLYDSYKILKDNVFGNCGNLGENLGALGADVAGALIPFATGAGAMVRGAGHLDDAADAARVVKGEAKLKYMDEWNETQRASADLKIQSYNELAEEGKLVARTGPTGRIVKTKRDSKSATQRYKEAYGEDSVPKGHEVDHVKDIQFGGEDTVENMHPFDASVNRSLGKQMESEIKKIARDGKPGKKAAANAEVHITKVNIE